jgi:hypothetical protein
MTWNSWNNYKNTKNMEVRKLSEEYEAPLMFLQEMDAEGLLCVSLGHDGYDTDEVEFDFGW